MLSVRRAIFTARLRRYEYVGRVLFCGAASTLAAAETVGYESVGIEKDLLYFEMARRSLPKLVAFKNDDNYSLSL